MEFIDFIYSIAAGILGGFVVLLYFEILRVVKERHWLTRILLPTLISIAFFILIIISASLIIRP